MKIITTDVVYLGKATPGSGGGGGAVIDALNVTPSTSAQTITASGGTDGYSPVNVAAVTSAIDANIVAGNIKKDVSILGVTGTYEGATPTGTITITNNGTHDVTNYATADVQVPTTAPALYREFRDNSGVLENSISTPWVPLPSTIHNLGPYILYRAYGSTPSNILSGAIDLSMLTVLNNNSSLFECFLSCPGITSVDLSSLTTVSGSSACNNMFYGCTGLTSVDLSSLTTVSGSSACNNMFYGCTGLTSVDLSALTTISGGTACYGMLQSCPSLTSANLSALTTISGSNACYNMFQNCTGITSADMSSLTTITGNTACSSMFAGCTSLATVYIGGTTEIDFGTRTNQFQGMFINCPQNIDVYAPAANQATIESFSGYPNFGGTGTVTWHWRS